MFDEKTIQQLRFYVYLLIDPKTDEPFYVGKGKANRVFDHVRGALKNTAPSDKYDIIKRIEASGQKVKHLIVRHGLNEKQALEIESSLIDVFKFIPKLSHYVQGNIQGGINAIEKGLMTTDEIIRLYRAVPLDSIEKNCVIININRTYQRGAGNDAIYRATKETWKIKTERISGLKFVLSEYKGLIVEVFEVEKWYTKPRPYGPNAKKAGQTYLGYGFDGIIAKPEIRNKYLNKTIPKKRGHSGVIVFAETLEKLKQKS